MNNKIMQAKELIKILEKGLDSEVIIRTFNKNELRNGKMTKYKEADIFSNEDNIYIDTIIV